jgi:hypothetical protein
MHILYLEDNQNDAQLIAKYIETTAHSVVLASDIETARESLASSPDLILVDVMINSERAGYYFARELRASGYQQPLIAITALNTRQDQLDCQQAGFDAVVTKPFQINDFVRLLSYYS